MNIYSTCCDEELSTVALTVVLPASVATKSMVKFFRSFVTSTLVGFIDTTPLKLASKLIFAGASILASLNIMNVRFCS